MKPHWFQILLAVAAGPIHGTAIMEEVLERTQGAMKLWPGTLYRSLRELEEGGWIVETDPSGDLREWFVDLEQDPSEAHRTAWAGGDGATYLRSWNAAEGSYEARSRWEPSPPDPEVREALKALGYIE